MHGQHTTEELELAWAAGFFDGEGTTCVANVKGSRRNYLVLRLSVGQVRREPLERFERAVRGGHITSDYTSRRGIYWRWTSGSTVPARLVLDQLWPYLSAPKQEQAGRALRRIEQDLKDNPRDHFKRLRERIVQLHAEGLNALQIASAVGRSRSTIYYHLRNAGREVTQ